MKVTALIPDDLVRSVQTHTGAKTVTESLITALRQWLELQEIRKLNRELRRKPLRFRSGFSAEKVRGINRR
ncbi:MAG: DUF2191 domain-containing protein [Planctomycetes bacterium]|nr:DUF2191 domain-containing protein [Planctomycetota bacterium]